MSCEIDGQNYSYDYEELIQDLKDDLEYGDILLSDIIYIVRKEHPELIHVGYKPIVDYYIADDLNMINGKLEDIYDRTEFTDDEWTEMEKNRLDMIVQYKADKDSLEKATVTAVLTEMQLWNSVI